MKHNEKYEKIWNFLQKSEKHKINKNKQKNIEIYAKTLSWWALSDRNSLRFCRLLWSQTLACLWQVCSKKKKLLLSHMINCVSMGCWKWENIVFDFFLFFYVLFLCVSVIFCVFLLFSVLFCVFHEKPCAIQPLQIWPTA